MGTKSLIPCFVILLMVSCVSSDFAEDKKECQDQLTGLSPCLPFVTGDAKAPTPTCCTELSKDAGKSKLCLCILVKDRNEPSLGFKLNTTLALSLPSICHINSNASVCPELLHLAPNSSEAQVFEQFDNSGISNSTSTGENMQSSSTRLSIRGPRQATMYGFFTWVLLSVFNSNIRT